MLPAIFRALGRALGAGEETAAETQVAKSAIQLNRARPFRKTAKVSRPTVKTTLPRAVRSLSKSASPTNTFHSRMRISPNGVPQPNGKPKSPSPYTDVSNATPPDTSESDKHRQDTTKDKTTQLQTQTQKDRPDRSDNLLDTATRLIAAQQIAKQAASSFIPSIEWSAAVSARGYKGTPLRTVLHYCLAVVFGMSHYQRYGHTNLKATLHPTENRVEVTFTMASSLLLEPVNIGFSWIKSTLNQIDESVRNIAKSDGLIAGIKKFVKGQLDPQKAVNDMAETFGNIMREVGAQGVFDMARRDYFAGAPPLSMMVPGAQPFTKMLGESQSLKKPLLTRSLAMNPQADRLPHKDYPTFTDLRSLVAQALYDPGVLPPTPDTFVALPDAFL